MDRQFAYLKNSCKPVHWNAISIATNVDEIVEMNTLRHWSQINETSLLWGIRFLFAIHQILGQKILQLVLYPVVFYYWLGNPATRAASISYLDKIAALKPDSQLTGNFRCSYQHLLCFANAIIDKIAAWSGDISLSNVSYQGIEALKKHLQTGRGALVLVSHLGNLDVCRMLATYEPSIKINVLVHTRHAQKFNYLLSLYNPDSKLNLLQVTEINPGTAMSLAEKIDNGELVIIAADRTPVVNNQRVVAVDFLGAMALFPQGPFVLAGLLRCPVYSLFCVKHEHKYVIIFELFRETIELPRSSREQAIKRVAESYAHRLADYCLSYPLQWFNFYDFWQAPTEQ
jgi:predicted LPLAT superfamily acyltransferase